VANGSHQTTDGASLKGEAREAYVEAMFDRISTPYDRLNRVISLGATRLGAASR
jgi:ubiquinone/menaquinone biosynthesis C-methylase UbiE